MCIGHSKRCSKRPIRVLENVSNIKVYLYTYLMGASAGPSLYFLKKNLGYNLNLWK